MKLELVHFSSYLPYNLKMTTPNGERILKGIDTAPGNAIGLLYWVDTKQAMSFHVDCKPLLLPLLELKDELLDKLNDKFFMGTMALNDEYSINHFMYELNNGHLKMPFWKSVQVYEWLLSKHFDVFNLINSGLAVPLNSQGVSDK